MSAPPATPARPAVGPKERRGPGRFRRRWYRLAIPAAVFASLVVATLVAWSAETPSLADPQVLTPTGAGPDGSSQLAERLAAEGVRVEFVTDRGEADTALRRDGAAVLFVPKPTIEAAQLVRTQYWRAEGDRVVLVAPSPAELWWSGLPARYQPSRWAARAAPPECEVPEAVAAGPAAVERRRYSAPDPAGICYGGGLVRVGDSGSEAFVVGASDPFRNDRIDEAGNQRLALELLTGRDRVIWFDALAAEPAEAPPPADPESEPEPRSRGELDRSGGNAFAGLVNGYPAGVLAGLTLALLLAVLVAVARARRLGAPVREPLPVSVPAVEAVVGRGRLYHRSRGRAAALRTLQAAAVERLARGLGLPSAPERAAVVAAVSAHCGMSSAEVERRLYGPAPASDEELTSAVAAVDELVATVAPRAGDDRSGPNHFERS
ncbi:DUF4350 domain-containing protein [Natronosporangium hydrolyticum]|uniref:DUF4350 domain-containing protein n=1 Tax=Natronosporangium hydrolyticum TaxID=2811111 RepID=A0A895YKD4_9ACTN|nr:DUF4350 domain-containing protein [Natronosporangium hydrolyticum]QSB15959.1 DUF4350 domain-containing protein [Natronosporangium hydrolyticum]